MGELSGARSILRHLGAIVRKAGIVKVAMSSILVSDQSRALAFSTDILGFDTTSNVDLGAHR